MKNIQMVDLKGQYKKIKAEIDKSVLDVIENASFINGPQVSEFAKNLSDYLGGAYVIPCANGTDALQIALMSLDLKPGDEVIVPSFTYVASAEVIGLLNLKPVLVDVDIDSFNVTKNNIEQAITPRTKAIIPVHLFGQCADMDSILAIAKQHNLFVIEDAAQAIGAKFTFSDGTVKQAGTMGDIGCTSFFPSKNLGCFGDGGAIFTKDFSLFEKIKVIANHGQTEKYVHKYIGVNSRLDSLQAAVLNVKLKYLDEFIKERQLAAFRYSKLLNRIEEIVLPVESNNSTHVFHQFTLRINNGKRNELKKYLESMGIPVMIYYPIPLNEQVAFRDISIISETLDVTKILCNSVLSLPMHTELTEEEQLFITNHIRDFFSK